MSTTIASAIAGALGLVFGSFLNVVAHRLPRGEALSRPPSHCPRCGAAVRARDNMPILSWLLLRGRCRDCGAPIPVRYPLVEALTGALCAAVVAVVGVEPEALIGIAFVLIAVPVVVIDLDHRIIPNKLTAVGAGTAVTLVAVLTPSALVEHLLAALGAGGFLLVAAIAYPAGMGMGDVKLAAVMGLFLGRAVAPAMFAALIAGSVVGVLVIARKGRAEGRKTGIPFGPFLVFGGLVGLFAGDAIVDWYLDTFV